MSYDTDGRIRWPVKPWGPLNKTGRLKNAPPARTLEQAIKEKEAEKCQ